MSAVERVFAGGPAPFAWRLVRARRRTIGVEISQGAVIVRAPSWVRLAEIHGFLAEKAAWVAARLAEWRAAREAVRPEAWRNGGSVRFQGEERMLFVANGARREVHADLFDVRVRVRNPSPERIREAVELWLREEARRRLSPKAAHYAGQLGLPAPEVRLSNARTQWGSCEAGGRIRLHWRLVQLDPALSDYVVAHEVAHLIHMDHSSAFWSVVAALCPAHATARAALRRLAPLIDD